MSARRKLPNIDWPRASRFDGPQSSQGFRLWNAFQTWQRQLNEILKPLGLNQPRFSLLAVVAWMSKEEEAVSQKQICDFCGMEKMQVSQGIKKLGEAGLVASLPNPADSRSKLHHLTENGADVLAKALPLVEKFDMKYFQD